MKLASILFLAFTVLACNVVSPPSPPPHDVDASAGPRVPCDSGDACACACARLTANRCEESQPSHGLTCVELCDKLGSLLPTDCVAGATDAYAIRACGVDCVQTP